MSTAYLRVSFTDRCNYRCQYCIPPGGIEKCDHHDLLSVERLITTIELIDSTIPLHKLRITGGEPLARKGLDAFVAQLRNRFPKLELTLTTNGSMLEKHAAHLVECGINRINVSIDSLQPDTFSRITGGGDIKDVIKGIVAAKACGIPVKTNTVLLRGLNDNELADFVQFGLDNGLHEVRFIELMAIGQAKQYVEKHGMTAKQAEAIITSRFALDTASQTATGRAYQIFGKNGHSMLTGFITPHSAPFCSRCNRLRLDARGRLLPCLFTQDPIPLGDMIKHGTSPEMLAQTITDAWKSKCAPDIRSQNTDMHNIGG